MPWPAHQRGAVDTQETLAVSLLYDCFSAGPDIRGIGLGE